LKQFCIGKSINEEIKGEEAKKEEKKIEEVQKENLPMKLDILRQTCDICMKSPILGAKYLCILCQDMVICGNCENQHNHPVIKFNNELIGNKDQLMKLMFLASNNNEENVLTKVFNKIENSTSMQKIQSFFKSSTLKAQIGCEYPYGIIAKPGTSFTLTLYLSNTSAKGILPKGVKILPLNNRDLEIQPLVTNFELESKQMAKVELKCRAPMKDDKYKVKFIVFHNNAIINIQPMTLDIIVGIDENAKLNEFFMEFEDIVKLPKEKKKILYEVVNEQLSSKNPLTIKAILEKYNWSVEFALDELMQ